MAQYTLLQYGSSGDEVKKLQQQLNSNGYSLDVDGQFGSATKSAVSDYQKKNGLTVDGIVGDETWGKLGSVAGDVNTSASQSGSSTAGTDTVARVTPGENPGAYTSQYDAQIQDIYNRIVNRQDFQYDLGADTLYQQYRDQYIRTGQQAMEDTAAKAAGLTGGYGSTYGTTAGQQMYNQYLQELNSMVPDLYAAQRDAYDQDTQALYNQYSMLADKEAQDYARWQDDYNRYIAERDYQDAKAAAASGGSGYGSGYGSGSGSGSGSGETAEGSSSEDDIIALAAQFVAKYPKANLDSTYWSSFEKKTGLSGDDLRLLRSYAKYYMELNGITAKDALRAGGGTVSKNRVNQIK